MARVDGKEEDQSECAPDVRLMAVSVASPFPSDSKGLASFIVEWKGRADIALSGPLRCEGRDGKSDHRDEDGRVIELQP